MAGMIHRYLRYARLGVRLLLPTGAERRYARAVRDSGLFDRDWYLACNPRLPRLCRMLPERHYVLVGEAAGLCPSPGFSPRAYTHLNPDQAGSGLPPLAHYLAHGRDEGRQVRDRPAGAAAPALPAITAADRPAPPARHAVVLHLHYRAMWPDFAARLARQEFDFDLFVTLTADPSQPDHAIRARILADFPQARIWTLPNHGRDILPFLHLAQSGGLTPYAAVCKLHTKKSPHREDGDIWREALLEGVIGAPARTAARLVAFLDDPAAGLWVADGHLAQGAQWWGSNRERGEALLARTGLAGGATGPDLAFAAGSIYWIKPMVLAALARLSVRPGDFEPEMGQVDGTLAHVLERVTGVVALGCGQQIRQASDLDRPTMPHTAPSRRGAQED